VDAVPPLQAELLRGRNELVLVVDDEATICDITRQTLEAFGYRVITASDGAEAIALYATQAPQIAVVLTDMMMPVVDGASTVNMLRHINPSVRIIAASGLEITENDAKVATAGVYGFLAKPYTAETLVRVIREVIDRIVVAPL
jgi:CheY-like chemotaxis protein